MATKTKTTKTAAPDFTMAGLAKEVTRTFRAYGFKAEGINIVQRTGSVDQPTGTIELTFAEEYATGMAAFSQDKVTVGASIYLGAEIKNRPGLQPWEMWSIDTLAVLGEEDTAQVLENGHLVNLEISYSHHNSGRNGITRRYVFKNGKLALEPKVH